MRQKKLPILDYMLLQLVLKRLLLPLLIVWISAIGGAGYFLMHTLVYQQQQIVKSMNQRVDRHLDQSSRILDAVARVAEDGAPEGMELFMQSTWEAYLDFDTIYYLDENRRVMLMVPTDPMYLDLDMSNFPDFQYNDSRVIISRPFISLRTGVPTVYLVRPLSRNRCVVGELNLGAIQDEIASGKGANGEKFFYILDQSGTLLAHPESDLVKQQTNMGYLEIFRRGLNEDTTLIYEYMGTKFMGNSTRINRVGWVIVNQISLLALVGPYIAAFGLTIIITLGIWLTLVWNLRKHLQQNVVAPLVQLSESTNALAIGDYSKVNILDSVPTFFVELNRLATDFQYMSSTLEMRQKLLRESEERYRSLFERVPTGLFRITVDGFIVDANQSCIRMFRFPGREEFLKINVLTLYLVPEHYEHWQASVEQETVEYFETQMRRYDETIIWVRIRCRVVRGKENRILYYDGSIEDFTKRKQAEEALRKTYDELEIRVRERTEDLEKANQALSKEISDRKEVEEALQAERGLFMGGPTIVFLWKNAEGWPVDYVSPNVQQILGYTVEEFLSGKVSYMSIVHPDDLEQVAAEVHMYTNNRTDSFEQAYRIITAHGETRWFLDFTVVKRNSAGEVTHYHGYMNDITERKVIETKMAQMERLNAIGEVAAGMGHEIRNPMTTVRGYLQLFQRKEHFLKYHDQFGMMIEELDRANSIITEFLSLAKDKRVEKQHGNINNVIQALFPILQAETFQKGHQLQTKIGEIPDSIFDEKEIRQLILNMVRNGLDAMENSGVVTIKTYSENGNIILMIQDTGSGIKAEVLGKLGTPFVTTKGSGTGLGLSICYRIVARHDGIINVHTNSEGTSFSIVFN